MGQKSLRIYGCGGAGINLTTTFALDESDSSQYAVVKPVFVDTSLSNLDSNISKDQCFILPDVDGSGKVRRENHRQISESVKGLLSQFEPLDFNIIVFSGSGGSGSVIGPLIARELLDQEASFLCIVVGSTESVITCENTLNTLKSLDAISKRAELPITIFYRGNNPETKRSIIDNVLKQTIARLMALNSGNNSELDTRDISTWLYYNRHSNVPAQISELTILEDSVGVEGVNEPISIASLMNNPDTPIPQAGADYHCTGYIKGNGKKETLPDMHFIISTGGIKRIYESLSETRERYLKASKKRNMSRNDMVADGDNLSEDDLVL